jgi:predicted CoA-binding protein
MNKQTLVMGASTNPNRYSNIAILKLLDNGFEVNAIGNKIGNVAGVKIFDSKVMFKNINTITLYLGAKNQKEYYNYIIDLKPKRVIFNPGTENTALESLLTKNNIYFEKACTLVLLSIGEY